MNRTAVEYMEKFSDLSAGILIYCGTVLNFFEVCTEEMRSLYSTSAV